MSKRKTSRTRGPRHQVLHAPWRIEYILGPKGQGCFFCEAGKLRADDEAGWRRMLLLYRDPHALVIMNRYPYIGGHLLVAPRRHTADLAGLSVAESRSLWELSRSCQRWLKETFKPQGFNLGMNLGRSAGAGVEEHLHMHVLPRWAGDTNFMPIVANTHSIPIALEAVWDELRPRFRKGPRSNARV
jgi:ATP adenylyltransferase